eukprot:SAG31_NODE_979_length_10600_cov_13.736025_8_plen_283_part_00
MRPAKFEIWITDVSKIDNSQRKKLSRRYCFGLGLTNGHRFGRKDCLTVLLFTCGIFFSAASIDSKFSTCAAENRECQDSSAPQAFYSCDVFLQMGVLEEVRAIASGRVPQVCRDRKTELNRRRNRLRSTTTAPYGTVESQLMAEREFRRFHDRLFSLRQVLQVWPFTQLSEPPERSQQLSVIERLDIQNHEHAARAAHLRRMELPFILYNISDINRAVHTWSNDTLVDKLSEDQISVTVARGRPSFMYFDLKASTPSWIKENNYSVPTEQVSTRFEFRVQHS